MKIYKCEKCGNILGVLRDSAIVPNCCGESMKIVDCNTDEQGAKEKHKPVYKKIRSIVNVCVGSEFHPSNKDHYIEWIILETNLGRYTRYLKPGDQPCATFVLADANEDVVNIYAYCNIHGLWSNN